MERKAERDSSSKLGWTVFGGVGDSIMDSISPLLHIRKRVEDSKLRDLVTRADGHYETGLLWGSYMQWNDRPVMACQ